jgi:hypothetical protein
MSLTHPDRSRSLPVRLCDIDPHVLASAARRAARDETDPAKIDELLWAATRPSDRVYYVGADAAPMLQHLQARVAA